MKRKQEIGYHIVFWILFILMTSSPLFFFTRMNPQWPYFQGSALVIQMFIFYVVYVWLAPKTIPQKKWVLLLIGILGCILLFVAIRYVVEEIVLYNITGIQNYSGNAKWGFYYYYFYVNSFDAFRIILLSLVVYFVKYIFNSSTKINQLKLEKKQAELRVLKSQLSPHFLFNTLNSFYAEALETNSKLSEDILKLSEMLRYVTYENEKDFVFLKDELIFIDNYISLFKRRFDDKLFIEKIFPKDVNAYKIPSLLLIHFIENTFKHGVLDNPDRPVKIELKIVDEQLLFTVENSFKPSENYDQQGIGYKNLRQRLKLIYKDNFSLDSHQKENRYFVSLQIPLKK